MTIVKRKFVFLLAAVFCFLAANPQMSVYAQTSDESYVAGCVFESQEQLDAEKEVDSPVVRSNPGDIEEDFEPPEVQGFFKRVSRKVRHRARKIGHGTGRVVHKVVKRKPISRTANKIRKGVRGSKRTPVHHNNPSKADLSSMMPPVATQGCQGSCTAWSTTYAVKSYHEKRKHGWEFGPSVAYNNGAGTNVFSPAWTYNQINHGRDKGSSITNALKLLKDKGAVPWKLMPYNQKDYRTQPDYSQRKKAVSYKIRDYKYLKAGNVNTIKYELSRGNPLIGSFKCTEKLSKYKKGVLDDHRGPVRGGHAMAIVGYDDNKAVSGGRRGAFKIMNSWGLRWGQNGYMWMSYRCFAMLCRAAYVPYDSSCNTNNADFSLMTTAHVTATRGTYCNMIVASWDEVPGAIAYVVERSIGASKDFVNLGSTQDTVFEDRQLIQGYRYNYRIVTLYKNGASTGFTFRKSRPEKSPVAEGFALRANNNKPPRICSFRAKADKDKVKISWNRIQGAGGYILVHWNDNKKKWEKLFKSVGNVYDEKNLSPKSINDIKNSISLGKAEDKNKLMFVHKTPLNDKTNVYRICSYNSSMQGSWSYSARVNMKPSTGRPGIVSGLKASQGEFKNWIFLSWDADPSAVQYFVYKYDDKALKWKKTGTSNKNNYFDKDAGIQSGKEYKYKVLAKSRNFYAKRFSSPAEGFTRSEEGSDSGSCMVPEGLRAGFDFNTRTVKLTWKYQGNGSDYSYSVFQKRENDEEFKLVKKDITLFGEKLNSNREKTVKIPLDGDGNELCFYTIIAAKRGEESAPSNIAVVAIPELTPTVMTTFVPGEGLRNFRGIWESAYIGKDQIPVQMQISIVDKKDRFTAQISFKNRVKKISGSYASKSRYLEANDFTFEMLEEFENDVANVVIPAGVFTDSRIVLNFSRENQDGK